MHNFPTKRRTIKSVAQVCVECDKWFALTQAEVVALQKHWEAAAPEPFAECTCKYCDHPQIAVIPGKYDRPNAPRVTCAVQHVVLR